MRVRVRVEVRVKVRVEVRVEVRVAVRVEARVEVRSHGLLARCELGGLAVHKKWSLYSPGRARRFGDIDAYHPSPRLKLAKRGG